MFTFNYTIKQEDLNYGNHVGNERALLFFQWAREEFLRANNLSETDIGDGIYGSIWQKGDKYYYFDNLGMDSTIQDTIYEIADKLSDMTIK